MTTRGVNVPASVASDLRRQAARLYLLAARLDPTPSVGAEVIPPGAALIARERARQITEEGFDAAHDSTMHGNELAWAAFCYLERAAQDRLPQADPSVPHVWPLPRTQWRPKQSRVRNLVVAAALIAAELDRLWETGERE
jgi:hypothetical protein